MKLDDAGFDWRAPPTKRPPPLPTSLPSDGTPEPDTGPPPLFPVLTFLVLIAAAIALFLFTRCTPGPRGPDRDPYDVPGDASQVH